MLDDGICMGVRTFVEEFRVLSIEHRKRRGTVPVARSIPRSRFNSGLFIVYALIPHFAVFRRPGPLRGVERTATGRRSGSGWRQGRVRWGRPLLSRPRGVVGSGPAAVLAAVLVSAAVSGFAFGCRVVVLVCRGFGCLSGSSVSSVCPRVRLCVPCVSRLPPVSFYRY